MLLRVTSRRREITAWVENEKQREKGVNRGLKGGRNQLEEKQTTGPTLAFLLSGDEERRRKRLVARLNKEGGGVSRGTLFREIQNWGGGEDQRRAYQMRVNDSLKKDVDSGDRAEA